ncbi:hypothetical protein F6U93_04270 [Tamlana haliotis]|uniref:Restriction endonuclease n=1 Tax=Pseudotamlana haliotis TaxID=2614804 RepID=A0A6N6MF94_9FLAO|nr:hypothetical protein [Tamlana haliotis]KAB1068976.1 hypothetical protein F6U93_04270 [Tamlana haliotis]
MNPKNYTNRICEIINAPSFSEKMGAIIENYSNLKQESFIRNQILVELNKLFTKESGSLRAFAEHPRINKSRVDLSIVNSADNKNPYKIEFKFQFSKDCCNMLNYQGVINKDFENRQSDLFILTIAHWDINEKKDFDKKWGITSNLSRYISKTDTWKQNILNSFKQFQNTELIEFEKIVISKPYNIEYYFYILRRQ